MGEAAFKEILGRGSLRTEESFGDSSSSQPNLLIHADNLSVMSTLAETLKTKVKAVYIDPPFLIGADLKSELSVGSESYRNRSNPLKVTAYSDRWENGLEEYLTYMRERLEMIYELLSDEGSLYLHCDWRTTAYFRILLDQIFGKECYVNECIWSYKTGGNNLKLGFGKKHDTIHFVVKNPKRATWNQLLEKSYLGHRYGFSNIEIKEDERGIYTEVRARDVWEIPALRGNQPERIDYPTQKPEALLERILLASTNPGDLVADLFSGSGTTAAVAERLGRRWLAVDKGELAIHTIRKRILDTFPTARFDLLRHEEQAPASSSVDFNIDKRKESLLVRLNGLRSLSSLQSKSSLDLVDLWAVDFNYQNEKAFKYDWYSFRTRSKRDLQTVTTEHTFGARIGIKVIEPSGREHLTIFNAN